MPRLHGFTRRSLLAGLGAAGLVAAASRPALANALDASQLGLVPNIRDDQSAALATALARAELDGRPLFLPGGTYFISDVRLPRTSQLVGVPGATMLLAAGATRILHAQGAASAVLTGLSFDRGIGGPVDDGALVEIADSAATITDCAFTGSGGHGLMLTRSKAQVERCRFTGHNHAGIFSLDSIGSVITRNWVTQSNNNGILVWGSEPRRDGTIVSQNHIERIAFTNGGNGQNGNGINVFRADGVIVSDNHIEDCAFTAVRLNATNDTIVRGNVCLASGEVAIFSEFGFSGSVIADNVVDGAAAGISITNFNDGGRLAVCSGNIVRNITPLSVVNPDTRPYGIFAEADATVTGNVIENVPGLGIGAGWGPYRRNLAVTGNMIREVDTGIAVSVVSEEMSGPVTVSGNLVAARRHGIAGFRWDEVTSPDLTGDAGSYPDVHVGENQVTIG